MLAFDSIFNLVRVLRAILKNKAGCSLVNIGFSTFARSPLAAFLGITIPAFSRLLVLYPHHPAYSVRAP